jgi:hypothetical protein
MNHSTLVGYAKIMPRIDAELIRVWGTNFLFDPGTFDPIQAEHNL